jgi:plastocyanin
MKTLTKHRIVAYGFLAVALAACGGDKSATAGAGGAAPANSTAAVPTAPAAPPTGKIITVQMISDDVGNYFKPANFEAHRGDVIRYTLTVGVHNVRFLADSNPGKKYLPPTSDLLQLPGQTFDVPVNVEPGTYYFQCDAHAALGMRGHVEVER